MSQNDLISIPKRKTPPREERVEWVPVPSSRGANARRIVTILVATVLFHVLLCLALPAHFATPLAEKKTPVRHDMKIHMVPPERRAAPVPPPPEPDRYVKATSAPENKPDQTKNFSSKDQQAAQVVESKDKTGDAPEIPDAKEENANAFETGPGGKADQPTIEELVQQNAEVGEEGHEEETRKAQPRQSEVRQALKVEEAPPLPAALKTENPGEGKGKGIAEYKEQGQAEKMPEKEAKKREIPAVVQNNPLVRMETPEVDPAAKAGVKLQPRPRLNLGMPQEVVRKSPRGVATMAGAVAIDSRLSEFGEYLDRMFEVIRTKWNDLNATASLPVPESHTHVLVSFYLNKSGAIEDLQILDTNSGQTAQWLCLDSIKANAPYVEWTPEMVARLGQRQLITIKFIYW